MATLTVEAAAQAGLPRVVLIEEPQAAFYAWVYKHAEDWQQLVSVGQKILVCDIGGGTTDFTLIRVRASETAGDRIQFHRVAVGNHLILGGDNLDLALARHIEQKLKGGGKLEARQWDVLVGTCHQVKEQLLGDKAPQRVTVSLPGGGSKLIGGSLQAEVTCQEVTELLVEGFLPMVDLNSKPVQHASGFQEFGLPYASDPAISKYLAAFLIAHRDQVTEKQAAKKRSAGKSGTRETAVPDSDGDVSLVRPDVVLFNGGFFESGVLRQRVLTALTTWFGKDNTDPKPKPAWEPIILDNDQLHLAVARGAAYYGMVRRGAGVRIAASLARSYYIGVESGEPQAVCIVPGSAETGQEFELSQRTFQLTISQPVEFSLFVSSTRLDDEPGEIFSIDPEQMTALPPIRTVLRAKSRNEKRDVAVRLHVRITEIGTIDLSCHEVDSDRSWKLQFDIRAATQTDVSPHQAVGEAQGFIDESIWLACRRQIADVFSGEGTAKPNDLIKRLAGTLECERHEWPMSLLRSIWEALMELEPGRRRSAAHEARWLNLLGYALRPGYGFAVDDWRVTETWRTVNGKLAHGTPNIRAEALILWRRLAGGLSLGQQLSIADPLLSSLRGLHRRLSGNKAKAAGTSTLRAEDTVEIWRLLGSVELLSIGHKVEIGNLIVDLLDKPSLSKANDAMFWALGRLGQRVPLYGPLNTVLPVERMSPWLDRLLDLRDGDPLHHLAIVQMTRRTEDRYRDLPEEKREEVVRSLQAASAAEHLVKLVAAGGRFDAEEQGRVFGEALPKGLRLE